MCNAKTVAEQERIWVKHLRPILLNKIMVKGFLGNP
jgi:betaine lipid synthase